MGDVIQFSARKKEIFQESVDYSGMISPDHSFISLEPDVLYRVTWIPDSNESIPRMEQHSHSQTILDRLSKIREAARGYEALLGYLNDVINQARINGLEDSDLEIYCNGIKRLAASYMLTLTEKVEDL